MMRFQIILRVCFFILTGVIGIHLLGNEALAADNSADWRSVFDLVMRWLNFGIIVFILIKYGRTPIKDFLLSRREELAREISAIEEEKDRANARIEETTKMLEESKARFDQIKERIIQEGEKKKQAIIEDAQLESRILLESAQKRIENQLLTAKEKLKSELVDMAISLAMARLPGEINAEDDQQLIHQFLAGASAK